MAKQWSQAHVRTHTRKTAGGGTTTVRSHQRRKRGPNARHMGQLGKTAWRHHRAGRKAKAAMFAGLVVGEGVLYLLFNGTAAVAAIAGTFLLGLSWILTR